MEGEGEKGRRGEGENGRTGEREKGRKERWARCEGGGNNLRILGHIDLYR